MMVDNEFHSGFVAVVGRPNVGKSSFINNILGQKIAAVSPKPQTTRKQQLAILSLPNAQIIFTDTPGIHLPKYKLGKFMNDEALDALSNSDLILFLADLSTRPHEEDRLIAEKLRPLLGRVPMILVLNKKDLISEESQEQRTDQYEALLPGIPSMLISAINDDVLALLGEKIVDQLPENPPFFDEDQITDLYEREISAELIREAALLILKDEVPHGIAVRIDEFTEREEKGAYIEATLFVERDSQKGIVIGKGGEMIKKISTAARGEIEKMSGRKVFLRLRVKLRKNWRNDDTMLKRFGFQSRN